MPCRADHSAYFGLANFIKPTLSAVDGSNIKESLHPCQRSSYDNFKISVNAFVENPGSFQSDPKFGRSRFESSREQAFPLPLRQCVLRHLRCIQVNLGAVKIASDDWPRAATYASHTHDAVEKAHAATVFDNATDPRAARTCTGSRTVPGNGSGRNPAHPSRPRAGRWADAGS